MRNPNLFPTHLESRFPSPQPHLQPLAATVCWQASAWLLHPKPGHWTPWRGFPCRPWRCPTHVHGSPGGKIGLTLERNRKHIIFFVWDMYDPKIFFNFWLSKYVVQERKNCRNLRYHDWQAFFQTEMIDFGFWIVYFNVMIWLRIRIDTI